MDLLLVAMDYVNHKAGRIVGLVGKIVLEDINLSLEIVETKFVRRAKIAKPVPQTAQAASSTMRISAIAA